MKLIVKFTLIKLKKFDISKYFDDNNLKIQAGVSSVKYFYGNETTIAELVCQIRL